MYIQVEAGLKDIDVFADYSDHFHLHVNVCAYSW